MFFYKNATYQFQILKLYISKNTISKIELVKMLSHRKATDLVLARDMPEMAVLQLIVEREPHPRVKVDDCGKEEHFLNLFILALEKTGIPVWLLVNSNLLQISNYGLAPSNWNSPLVTLGLWFTPSFAYSLPTPTKPECEQTVDLIQSLLCSFYINITSFTNLGHGLAVNRWE